MINTEINQSDISRVPIMFVVDAPGGTERAKVSRPAAACAATRGNFTHIPEVNIGRKTAAENMKKLA